MTLRHCAASLVQVGCFGAAMVVLGGCTDDTAPPQEPVYDLYFKRAGVVGAWPARLEDGVMVRQCAPGPIDGIIFNTFLESSARVGSNDTSLGPGDTLIRTSADGLAREFWTLDGSAPDDWAITDNDESLSVGLDCLDPLPDSNGSSTCDGIAPSRPFTTVGFRRLSRRDEGRDVVFLVDVSGSTSGLVDVGSTLENPTGTFTPPASPDDVASDPRGYRWSATRAVIEALGPDDRVGVVAFGEELGPDGLASPCQLLDAGGQDVLAGKTWREAMDACFATDKDPWLAGLSSSPLAGAGRSNLWHALLKTYEFLEGNEPSRHKHIVVITDGPDTCGTTSSSTPCLAPCDWTVSADEFTARIAGDSGLSVHFVQFDSIGYRGPDAKQMEVACISGGHHRFINRTRLPNDNPAAFLGALTGAVNNLRLVMGGTWQVSGELSALGSGQTPPGTLFAPSGQIRVAGPPLESPDFKFFAGGENGVVDERPIFRKACGSGAECGASGATEACWIHCSGAGLCRDGLSGAPAVNGATCGQGSTCCTDSAGATMCLEPGQDCDTCP